MSLQNLTKEEIEELWTLTSQRTMTADVIGVAFRAVFMGFPEQGTPFMMSHPHYQRLLDLLEKVLRPKSPESEKKPYRSKALADARREVERSLEHQFLSRRRKEQEQ